MFGNDQFTKILLHFDGTNNSTTFTDNNLGGSAHTWTAHGGAKLSTTSPKFGTAAGLFTTVTTDWITTPDSADFTLGSQDFTVDGWFNVAGSTGTLRFLFGTLDASGTSQVSVVGSLTSSNTLSCGASANGTVSTSVISTTTFTAAGWHHFAFVRVGNILRLFIDGTQEGGDVAFSSSVWDSTASWGVGEAGDFIGSAWNGGIDEFRLSVGIARWTSNFTPPNEPFDVPVSPNWFTNYSDTALVAQMSRPVAVAY